MQKTVIIGGHNELNSGLALILAGSYPNIVHVINSQKGYWIILHDNT